MNSNDLSKLSFSMIDMMDNGRVIQWAKRLKFTAESKRDIFEMKSELKLRVTLARKSKGKIQGLQRDQFIGTIKRKMEQDRLRREALNNFIIQIRKLPDILSTLDEDKDIDLDRHFLKKFSEIRLLEESSCRCPIMITGEISTGKSSFINLLLGQNILPTSIQCNTSAFIRIKYAEERSAEFRDFEGKILKEIKESDCIANGTSFTEEIRPYTEMKKDRLKAVCFSGTVYCNAEILKDGLEIIDSPGYGECDKIDSRLSNYVKEACGVIFVLKKNIGTGDRKAGGIFSYMKYIHDMMSNYHNGSVLFILNMWDELGNEISAPSDKNNQGDCRSRVYKLMLRNLQNCWPGLTDEHVLTLSTRDSLKIQNALRSQDSNYVSDGMSKVLNAIHQLWATSLKNATIIAHRKLMNSVENLLTTVNLSLESTKFSIVKEEHQRLKARLQLINSHVNTTVEESKKLIQQSSSKGLQFIRDRLHNTQLVDKSLQEVVIQIANDKRECLDINEVNTAIDKQAYIWLLNEMNKWKDESRFFEYVRADIAKKFNDNLGNEIADKIEAIEKDFKTMTVYVTLRKNGVSNKNIFRRLWDGQQSNKFAMEQFKEFLDDSKNYIRKRLHEHLVEILKPPQAPLEAYYERHKDALIRFLDNVKDALLDHEEKLNKELMEKTREVKELEIVASTYQLMAWKAKKLYLALLKFEVFHLQTENFDLHFSDLEFDEKVSSFIESNDNFECTQINIDGLKCKSKTMALMHGKFNPVVSSLWKHENDPMVVILKVKNDRKEYLENLLTILGEYKSLILTPHPCFITVFYRVKMPYSNDCTSLLFVSESVECNLYSHLFERHLFSWQTIGQDDKDDTSNEKYLCLLDIAQQIGSGLQYLHDRNLVHMELSIHTIGVTATGSVKLLHINLPGPLELNLSAQSTDYILQMCRYPPEILNPQDTNRIYKSECDIYSLGMTLYEAWTGVIPYLEHICKKSASLDTIEKFYNYITTQVSHPCLQHFQQSFYDNQFKMLIMRCWQTLPGFRIPIDKFLRYTSDLRHSTDNRLLSLADSCMANSIDRSRSINASVN